MPSPQTKTRDSLKTRHARQSTALAPDRPSPVRFIIGACAILVLSLAVFQPALGGEFIWDDWQNIVDNRLIHAADGLRRFWLSTENYDYWPLTSSTWWIEWRIFRFDTHGYHLVNLALHVGGAVVFWRILKLLRVRHAWLIAALFAIHPVNVESVSWITERKNTLSMFLGMCSGWLFLRSALRSEGQPAKTAWRPYLGALLVFVLGLLAKTSIVTLPGVFLILLAWRRGKVLLADLLRLIPFFAASLAMAGVTVWFQYHRSIGRDPVRDDALASRVTIAAKAVWFYFSKLLAPVNLCFVYPRWKLEQLSPVNWLPLAALLLLWGGGLAMLRRTPAVRGAWVGLTAYLLLLLPILGIFNIYFMRFSLVSDHWQYIASSAGIALIVSAAGWGLDRLRIPQTPRSGLAAVALIACLFLARREAQNYVTDQGLWVRTLQVNPQAWIAHANLAAALSVQGRDDQALAHWEQANAEYPGASFIEIGWGNSLARTGHTEAGISAIKRGIEAAPTEDDGYFTLGNVYSSIGENELAVQNFRKAIELKPTHSANHVNLGIVLARLGRLPEAVNEYRAALAVDPEQTDANYHLGIALISMGDLSAAMKAFDVAAASDPGDARPYEGRGIVFLEQRKFKEAVDQFVLALQRNPESESATSNLAEADESLGDLQPARRWYIKALRLNPANRQAQEGLHRVDQKLGSMSR